MGACASRFKVLKDSGEAPKLPVTNEEAAAAVVEEELNERDEAKNQPLGQMLIQENERNKCQFKSDSKASGELEQEDSKPRENEDLKSHEGAEAAEKTEESPIQNSNLETFEKFEDKKVAEPVKAVEFEGHEESATGKKPEAKKSEN